MNSPNINMIPQYVPQQLFLSSSPALPPSPDEMLDGRERDREAASCSEEAKLLVLVQPNDVQVKRVGRASCIEPDIKLCVEMDPTTPRTVNVNAYLKVLGKDNKHKLILLRKSDDITFSKSHKREIVQMKLRFLKTIKVQVLKRNLGVSRPEASIVFEVVNKLNECEGSVDTHHFAIISDPRYLDEVKNRRACERNEPALYPSHSGGVGTPVSDDEYHPHPHTPTRRIKRRRLDKPYSKFMLDEPASPSDHEPITLPHIDDAFPYDDMSLSPSSPPSSPSVALTPLIPPPLSDALLALKDCADSELCDSKEEQRRLIKLVEALKHKGCNFHILPPRARI